MLSNEQVSASCPAREICSMHDQLCSPLCAGFMELDHQLKLSEIPRRYYNIGKAPASSAAAAALIKPENPDAAGFIEKYGADIDRHVANGTGLYLVGSTGTGKTTSATGIALDYIRYRVSHALGERRAVRGLTVLYVNVPIFLRLTKQIYENDQLVASQASATVAELTRKMLGAPLLVLDDIGAEKPSESVRERMLTILEHRTAERLATIYSSNLALAELEITLGSRIRSRVEGSTIQLSLAGTDHRRD